MFITKTTSVLVLVTALSVSACGLTFDSGKLNVNVSLDKDGNPTAGVTGTFEMTPIPSAIGTEEEVRPAVEEVVSGSLATSHSLTENQAAVLAMIEEVAIKNSIDAGDFATVGWIESRLKANAKNPLSSASGVYQFISSTGRSYGLDNPFDARANIEAAARLWKNNRSYLMKRLGREPTGAEMYLAHQQGAGGAVKLITEGTQAAANLVGKGAIKLNTTGNASSTSTAAEFVQAWAKSFSNHRKAFFLK